MGCDTVTGKGLGIWCLNFASLVLTEYVWLVSVVMSLGDSITAAFAERSTLDEARDISW